MALTAHRDDLQSRTIADFGEQWSRFPDSAGYFASPALLADVFGPLATVEELRGARIAEVGSGAGRIVRMLLEAEPAHVVALEPSAAFRVLAAEVADAGDRVTLIQATGDRLPAGLDLDLVLSIGVLHHIPDPAPTMRAIYRALRPGGKVLVWVYGREGNRLYLSLLAPLRWLARRLPERALDACCAALARGITAYWHLCRRTGRRLPLSGYLSSVWSRLDARRRRLVVYDQLKPSYSRYYRRREVESLLTSAGFEQVELHHRHGYSWTATGRRPPAA